MKKQLIITLTVLILVITLVGAVSATVDPDSVKYVSPTGSDDNDGTETNPYLTIGKGITSVSADGTVNVADGTYYEHLTISKNLNLVGQSEENTIIDGSNTGRPLTIHSGATVGISLFTIQNGNGAYGGGIGNFDSTLTVSDSTISGNTANYGGGINNEHGTVTVFGSIISGNTANYGGGINNEHGTVTVFGSIISGNTANYGGGIYNGGQVTIENCELISNSASNTQGYALGGAIYNILGTLSIDNSKIQKNSATGAWNSGSAGAIYNLEGFLTIKNSLVEENTAQYGGALFFIHQTINVVGEVLIENCSISKNIATGSAGAWLPTYPQPLLIQLSVITSPREPTPLVELSYNTTTVL